MFDRVPSVEGQFLDTLTETVASSTADTISSIWSRVVDNKLTQKQLDGLQALRSLLTEVVDDIDPTAKIAADLAGEEYVPGKITRNTKMYDDYLRYQQEYYFTARSELAGHLGELVAAQTITEPDPEAVARITRAAHGETDLKRRAVDIALRRWESHGHKSRVERAQALIKQITERSMVVYKDELQRSFDHAFVSNPALPGSSNFPLTTLLPPDFDASEGWSDYSFTSIDMDTYKSRKSSTFSAGGSAGFLGFGASASASTSKTRTNNNFSMEKFTIKFQLTQTPIIRAGFEPGFFWMRGWDLDRMWDLNYSDGDGKRVPLSDGKSEPNGRLVAYATSAIWVRNVVVECKDMTSAYNASSRQISAGGSAGWGPFRVKSSGSTSTANSDSHYNADTGKLTIKGMQCIGTINNLIPTCPNPHPDLDPADFVGGEG